jgi:outer membrane protein OmpA-like peptidoglycan-associated protein
MRLNSIKILSAVFIVIFKNSAEGDFNTNQNSIGQLGLNESYSAKTIGSYRWAISFRGNLSYDQDLIPLLVRQAGLNKESHPYALLYDLFPAVSFGVTKFIDLSIAQPIYFDILEGELPIGGAGDLNCAIKCGIPGNKARIVEGAILTKMTVPYTDNEKGYFMRHLYYLSKNTDGILEKPVAYYSAQKPTLSLVAITTVNKKDMQFHANFGTCFTFNNLLDNALICAAGIEIRPYEWLDIFTDIYCEPRWKSVFHDHTLLNDQFRLSPGITLRTSSGTMFSIGSSIRLSSTKLLSYVDNTRELLFYAKTEPFWKAFVQISWSSGDLNKGDRDNDQIIDRNDNCPDIPEDFDGYKDHDGCPDIDNDQDNIPDERDSCKNVPEDIDGYNDLNGCPDTDNDNDGIPDSLDNCRDISEDKDGFMDNDGCPDIDNDNDGIPDSIDKCITIPEDKDSFDDADGCPDIDNDTDGTPDSIDQCPDSVGMTGNDGCPKTNMKGKEIQFGRLILPGVHFVEETTELTEGSLVDLDRLFHSLSDWPEVHIEIQAHVDNSITTQKALKLSQKRAMAVSDYLIKKGIARSRLKAIGKGDSTPIADNETIEGRILNNRIEIYRIKIDK